MLANKANNINPNNSDILNLVGLYSNDVSDADSDIGDYFKKSQKIKENATAVIGISSIYWGLDKKIFASYLEKNISK